MHGHSLLKLIHVTFLGAFRFAGGKVAERIIQFVLFQEISEKMLRLAGV